MKPLGQAAVAEFVGTAALCFFGIASILMAAGSLSNGPKIEPSAGLVTIALAHGLILTAFIAGCGYISGAHFNPAVTLATVIARRCDLSHAVTYWVAQVAGALAGTGLWLVVLGPAIANAPEPKLGATIGAMTLSGNVAGVAILEGVATFALAFVVLTSAVDRRAGTLGPIAIGATVTACILAIGPLTGASMNPARSVGPAVLGQRWDLHWLYWAAPLGGAALAGVVYRVAWSPRQA